MEKKTSSVRADTAALSQLREENATLKQEVEDLRRKLERMNELLLNAQRARFGQSSEKRSYVIPEQLGMFNEAEAVTYAQNQKPYLSAFLDHGEVDISNNFAENAIRPFAVGRKNWLFSDITKGAESSALVYTLVETAKANGLDPYAYLTELPYLGRNPSQDDLDLFLPWPPTPQAACTPSISSKSPVDL